MTCDLFWLMNMLVDDFTLLYKFGVNYDNILWYLWSQLYFSIAMRCLYGSRDWKDNFKWLWNSLFYECIVLNMNLLIWNWSCTHAYYILHFIWIRVARLSNIMYERLLAFQFSIIYGLEWHICPISYMYEVEWYVCPVYKFHESSWIPARHTMVMGVHIIYPLYSFIYYHFTWSCEVFVMDTCISVVNHNLVVILHSESWFLC